MAHPGPMPRYFFHTEDGRRFPDKEGTDLPDIGAARSAAIMVLSEVLRDNPDEFWTHERFKVTVTDEAKRTLFTIRMTLEP